MLLAVDTTKELNFELIETFHSQTKQGITGIKVPLILLVEDCALPLYFYFHCKGNNFGMKLTLSFGWWVHIASGSPMVWGPFGT